MAEANIHVPYASEKSLIVAMHAQWERAWATHNLNDEKGVGRSASDGERMKRDRAMETCFREATHLQLAILYQVPHSHLDVTILQFHIQSLTDGVDARRSVTRKESAALSVAVDSVFEFLASAIDERIGYGFESAAEFIRIAREYRTEQPSATEA
jgi:hypothetical protein